jgi:hypothetical protein
MAPKEVAKDTEHTQQKPPPRNDDSQPCTMPFDPQCYSQTLDSINAELALLRDKPSHRSQDKRTLLISSLENGMQIQLEESMC